MQIIIHDMNTNYYYTDLVSYLAIYVCVYVDAWCKMMA
jgi:hypothetical protein